MTGRFSGKARWIGRRGALLLGVALAGACSGGREEEPAAMSGGAVEAGAPRTEGSVESFVPEIQIQMPEAVSVNGFIRFDGPRPAPQYLKMNADKKCEEIHGETPVANTKELIGEEGELQNVFVYIKSGLPQRKWAVPTEPAVLDQNGCMYQPRVQGVRVGQTFNILNSDPTTHNVRCFAKSNPPFNLGQPGPGTRQKVFHKAEMEVKFKCDVHPWMFAYVFVMEHPFYAVTGPDGTFSISGLPPGEYVLAAWHEVYGEQQLSVSAVAADVADANFTFTPPAK